MRRRGNFELGGERVPNHAEGDVLGAQRSGIFGFGDEISYSHWQNSFTSLKPGFKCMNLCADFKGNFIYFARSIISLYPVLLLRG